MIIVIISIIVALPISIVLALDRRLDMRMIRSLSIVYIEVWRGAPLNNGTFHGICYVATVYA